MTADAHTTVIETVSYKRFVFSMSGSAAATALRRAAKRLFPEDLLHQKLPENIIGRSPSACFFLERGAAAKVNEAPELGEESFREFRMFDIATINQRKAKVGNSLMDAVEVVKVPIKPFLAFHIDQYGITEGDKAREDAGLLEIVVRHVSRLLFMGAEGQAGVLVAHMRVDSDGSPMNEIVDWDVISSDKFAEGMASDADAAVRIHAAVMPTVLMRELEEAME